jgi:hypothetical protein
LEENEDIMGGSIENPEAVQQFMQNVKVLYDSVTAVNRLMHVTELAKVIYDEVTRITGK